MTPNDEGDGWPLGLTPPPIPTVVLLLYDKDKPQPHINGEKPPHRSLTARGTGRLNGTLLKFFTKASRPFRRMGMCTYAKQQLFRPVKVGNGTDERAHPNNPNARTLMP